MANSKTNDQLKDKIADQLDQVVAGPDPRDEGGPLSNLIPPPPQQPTANPQVEVTPETANAVTTMSSLAGGPDVIVDAVVDYAQPSKADIQKNSPWNRYTIVRCGQERVEDMAISAGGVVYGPFTLEPGNEYRVPVAIADELERSGKLWH